MNPNQTVSHLLASLQQISNNFTAADAAANLPMPNPPAAPPLNLLSSLDPNLINQVRAEYQQQHGQPPASVGKTPEEEAQNLLDQLSNSVSPMSAMPPFAGVSTSTMGIVLYLTFALMAYMYVTQFGR